MANMVSHHALSANPNDAKVKTPLKSTALPLLRQRQGCVVFQLVHDDLAVNAANHWMG